MISISSISEQEFKIISKIGHEVISTLEINEVIDRVYMNINKLFDAKIFAIGIFNPKLQNLEIWGINGVKEQAVISKEVLSDNSFWLSYCFNTQKSIIENNYNPQKSERRFSNSLFNRNNELRKSFIYIPLSINNKRLGTLTVQSYQKEAYDTKHFQIVKNIASYISVAIQNASNFRKIKLQKEEIQQKSVKLEYAQKDLVKKAIERTSLIQYQKKKPEETNRDLNRLSLVAKHTENAIMIMDSDGYVQWINNYFTKLYEYSYEEFISFRGKNIRNTSFNPEIDKILTKCKTEKKVIEYEALNETVSGKKIWTQTSLTPILDQNNEVTNIIAIDKDISKRKEAELEALRRKEEIEKQAKHLEEVNAKLERLSIVARKTENGIMIMDAKGNIQWINQYFTKIYGYTFEVFLEKRGRNILETSFNPNIGEVLKRCLETKKPQTYSAPNVKQNGKEVWTQTTLTPVLNNKDEIEYLVTIDTDITKRKLAEAKVKKQNADITDSIKYARKIQKAIQPTEKNLNSLFLEYFILNKPRNIVSGDFYWVKKVKKEKHELIILAVADCTGHGVPGAFVSMLEISLLEDIISNNFVTGEISKTSEILDRLRERTKQTLNQNGNENNTKDGMDIALCIIDKKNKQIQFSGANNPLYRIYTNNDRQKELKVYKPTKNPIGLYLREKEFKETVFRYSENELLYLFSDGIIDQFGGEKGRKFMAKNFKNLLLKISHEDMKTQMKTINNTIANWRKGFEQVDDILVMGIKL